MKVLALSGGKDSMAVLHLMRDELACAIFADIGFSYPEQHDMVAYAETLIPVHRVSVNRAKNHREQGLPADVVPVEWTTLGQVKRVRALKKGDIEVPTDYLGVLYKPIDPDGAWEMTLAREIKESGISIDLNKVLH